MKNRAYYKKLATKWVGFAAMILPASSAFGADSGSSAVIQKKEGSLFYGSQLNIHSFDQEVDGSALEYAFPEFAPSSFWTMSRLVVSLGFRNYQRIDENGKREDLDSYEFGVGLRQYWVALGPLLLQQQVQLGRNKSQDKVGFGDEEEVTKYSYNYIDLRESLSVFQEDMPVFVNFGIGLRSNFLKEKPFTVGGVLVPESSVYPFLDLGFRF